MLDLADRLSEQLQETDNGCWEFTGCRTGSGYGAVYVGNRKSRSAHKVAYELTFGEVPKGMLICHKCDNKICCNPDHLFLGTHNDNKKDEIAKGRHVYGERQGHHKLLEEDVRYIISALAIGEDMHILARRYDVTWAAIYQIKVGNNWKHLR